ncbi:MAG TPA: glycosyltransferase family 39 protein [Thermoanaerobaculia bacterium]|nr:glycosyltransferase family 39 protein [Thermoanaerobaculia bacterium]
MERETKAAWTFRGLVAVLLVGYGVLLFFHKSTSVGGSDSSGYLNAARAIASGRVLEPIDALARLKQPVSRQRLFIPLGYIPGHRTGTMVTMYPIGLPLQAIALAAIFGWSVGPFLIGPLSAVVSVLLVYLCARELDLPRLAAAAAAAMFASVPVLTFFALQLMSDVPAALWALAAVWLALKSRGSALWAAGAGMAFGIGVLVRPSSAILLLPLAFALAPSIRAWAAFLAGGIPAACVFLTFNRAAYGGPLRTGYSEISAESSFSLANLPSRLAHYAYWISAMMSPLILPVWLAAAFDRLRPLRRRLLLFSWFAVFYLFYSTYGPYETWWYTRYLLPGIPALAIAAAVAGVDLLAWFRNRPGSAARRVGKWVVAASFVLVCGKGIRVAHRFDLLDVGRGESAYPETVRWAAARVPARSLVLAMQFSGAMRCYGLRELVRWDWIDPKDFPVFRRETEAAGYRFYALMLPFEVEQATQLLPKGWKFVGSNRGASLFELPPER